MLICEHRDIYIYIHTHTHTHTHTHIYIYIYTHTHIHIYICIFVYVYIILDSEYSISYITKVITKIPIVKQIIITKIIYNLNLKSI